MILSDLTIKQLLDRGETLIIDPMPQDWQIQPASVELTLGTEFMSPYVQEKAYYDKNYMLLPGECVLATTAERISLSASLVGRVEGKSSWGRRFLMIHSTAGFVDPGFDGQITLELCNLSNVSQLLTIGDPIAQISFQWTDAPVTRPYGSDGLGSHYQNQAGVTASAIEWR